MLYNTSIFSIFNNFFSRVRHEIRAALDIFQDPGPGLTI